MQKISSVSFKGVEQKPLSKNSGNVSNPIGNELGVQALPVGDRSLAINPSMPTEFLNESDLARYKKVQEEWAQSFSQRYNIPFENVLARLPEIRIIERDKDKELLTKRLESRVFGAFSHKTDDIEMNPIREIANSHGGDEARIVHESVHGYLHHLRRDYVEQLTEAELNQKVSEVINAKMINGEMGYTLKLNEKTPNAIKVVKIPILSSKERLELIKFMTTLNRKEHLDEKPLRLNEEGIKLLKEKLLPVLTDYSRTVSSISEIGDNRNCDEIVEYINASFFRKALIIGKCKTGIPREGLLLTKSEQEMANRSIEQYPELLESTHLVLNSKLPGSKKSYFMSSEELLARKESSIFRLERVNQKIKDIKAKGIKISPALLKEQEISQTNIKLIELVEEISAIEKQIITAEKQIAKIKKNNIRRDKGAKKLKVKNADELSEFLKTKKGWNKIATTIKVAILWETDKPEKLLTDTNENKILKKHFDDLSQQIKALSSKSDLTAIPAKFTKMNIRKICKNLMNRAIFDYWLKRLK